MRTAVAKQKRPHHYRGFNPESPHPTRTRTSNNSTSILGLQRDAGNRAIGQFLQTEFETGNIKQGLSAPLVKTAVAGLGVPADDAPSTVHHALSSRGQPLPVSTRQEMEERFGHDFSRVRIHTDSRAAESALSVGASAYTVGQDVVFSDGSYAPHSQQGSKLLAHELAHVIQQERGGASAPPLQGGALEQDADAAASAFVSGSGPIAVRGASAPGLACQPLEKEKKRRLRDMLNLDPSKPQDQQLGSELDLIENLLAVSGTPLNDTAIVAKALELHKRSNGKVGDAVLAYYDRVVAGAVGGMLAQAAAPVVIQKDPSGEVKVLLRAGELALAHRNLQIDTALNLIEGFAKAGAVAIAGSLAGGLLMLAAAAAPAVFGAYASVSTMSAEAVTALALRLAPRLIFWAARNPVLAGAVVTTVVSTVLEVAETGTVDPMGIVFNLLHLRYTQLQTRTPPSPTTPSPNPTPTLTVKQGGSQGSGTPTGMLRDVDSPSPSVQVPASHPVFKNKPPANDNVLPGKVAQQQKAQVVSTGTGGRADQVSIVTSSGTSQDPSRLRMATSGGSGRRPPTPGSVQPSNTSAPPAAGASPGPPRRVHPHVIPRSELRPKPESDINAVIDSLIAEEAPVQKPAFPGQRPALAGKFDHEKLPRPQAFQGMGAQKFGLEAIEWGAGAQGANSLVNTIRNNPQGAQEYFGRLRNRGITSDMARAWAEFYEKEFKRMSTNMTAKARASLMRLIAERL